MSLALTVVGLVALALLGALVYFERRGATHLVAFCAVLLMFVVIFVLVGSVPAHADDATPPPVRVSALPVGTLAPIPSATPTLELLPATTITLIDVATIIPNTVKPKRLANTGGPDLALVAGFALVVCIVTAGGIGWVTRWPR